MRKTIEELLAPQPEVRPRIYAYSIDDKPHAGHHGLYRTVMARSEGCQFDHLPHAH